MSCLLLIEGNADLLIYFTSVAVGHFTSGPVGRAPPAIGNSGRALDFSKSEAGKAGTGVLECDFPNSAVMGKWPRERRLSVACKVRREAIGSRSANFPIISH